VTREHSAGYGVSGNGVRGGIPHAIPGPLQQDGIGLREFGSDMCILSLYQIFQDVFQLLE